MLEASADDRCSEIRGHSPLENLLKSDKSEKLDASHGG